MKTYILFIVFFIITYTHAQLPHTFTQTARNTHYGYAYAVAVDSQMGLFFVPTVLGD